MKRFFPCLLFILSAILPLQAQTIYVTSMKYAPEGNKTYVPTLGGVCDTASIHTCYPTNDTVGGFAGHYTDMAIDGNQNIYHVTSHGSLYRRQLGDTTSCVYLGSFPEGVNSLVTDSAGTVYAAGNLAGMSRLYSYANGVFNVLGTFPSGIFSAGDLFFYEHRLFMTTTNHNFTTSALVEVSLPDPAQSCHYMGLINLQPWAAFSVRSGQTSRAFIFVNSGNNCHLVELDIPSRTINGNILCEFTYVAAGAAVYYDRTATVTSCIPTTALSPDQVQFEILNPNQGRLRIHTTLNPSEVQSLQLTNISGATIKSYSPDQFPDQLDLDGLATGLYLLRLGTVDGRWLARKVVVD